MNKKKYLKSIIDEGKKLLNDARTQKRITINPHTGEQMLIVMKYDYEKWMAKTNDFLRKIKYTNCQVKINGSVPYSEIISTKLALVTALYESFDLEVNCIRYLTNLPDNVHKLFEEKLFSEAVFETFKYIEVLVKEKSGLNDLYGMDLMRKAFSKKDGPLKNNNIPEGEQVAQMELYSGAIGFIKNPKSHNIVDISEEKTIELLHFGNYLLRVLLES